MTEDTLSRIVDEVMDRARVADLEYANGLIACRLLKEELNKEGLEVKIISAPVIATVGVSRRTLVDYEDADRVVALVEFYGKVIMVDFALGKFHKNFPAVMGVHPIAGEAQVFIHDGVTIAAIYEPNYSSDPQPFETWPDYTQPLNMLLAGLEFYDPEKKPEELTN